MPPPTQSSDWSGARPIVIDCDPGIDDAIALLLALACGDRVDLAAITTVHGNVGAEATARNARRIRALAGRPNVPVHAGCPRPMTAGPHHAAHVHGDDGLGGVILPGDAGDLTGEHGVDALTRHGESGHTLVAVGPLTNVAVALVKRPALAQKLERLVVMGGGLQTGNVTPRAEFNIFADPEAARTVLSTTEWPATRLPVVFPLDATHQAMADAAWIEGLGDAGGAICRAAADMLGFYLGAVGARRGGVHIHDAMAVAWTIRPELFETRRARLEVMTDSGPERGRTVADFDAVDANAEIVTGVDAPAFLDWLTGRLVALDRDAGT